MSHNSHFYNAFTGTVPIRTSTYIGFRQHVFIVQNVLLLTEPLWDLGSFQAEPPVWFSRHRIICTCTCIGCMWALLDDLVSTLHAVCALFSHRRQIHDALVYKFMTVFW